MKIGNMYHPDKWVIIKLTRADEIIYKVFGSWYGGYANSDSWRLNSGIVRIEKDEDVFLFHGYSGSTYACHKGNYGMHLFAASTISRFTRQAEESGYTLDVMDEDTDWSELNL